MELAKLSDGIWSVRKKAYSETPRRKKEPACSWDGKDPEEQVWREKLIDGETEAQREDVTPTSTGRVRDESRQEPRSPAASSSLLPASKTFHHREASRTPRARPGQQKDHLTS